jgi:hypothetical protein
MEGAIAMGGFVPQAAIAFYLFLVLGYRVQ